jgi:uncharacterized membrane protein
MDEINGWLDPILRWFHVVAGVLWIGLLYFFNWVNGPYQGKIDAETKKKANPELLPRALYFFRWGAAYTWITGILLIAIVYYMNAKAIMVAPEDSDKAGMAQAALLVVLIAPFIYDALWKAMAKNEMAGMVVSFLLVVGVMALFQYVLHLTARSLYIHVGAMFGTIMAFNVWFRIWPNQRKIITGLVDGKPADASIPALAGLRSKHNTYMSVPLIFTMVSNHMPKFLGFMGDKGWLLLAGVIAFAWQGTKHIYKKAGKPEPALYREEGSAAASEKAA